MGTPFTQSWIQSLTGAADNPNARRVKPRIEWVNRLVRNSDLDDRVAAANELWEYAEQHCLADLLKVIPGQQTRWEFERDDQLLYEQKSAAPIDGLQDWKTQLGVEPGSFELTAEVNGTEWGTLVREQAVRHQQAYDPSIAGTQSTLHLGCTATWNGRAWKVGFASPSWMFVEYEDSATVERPEASRVLEIAKATLAEAEKLFTREATPQSSLDDHPWVDCVGSLSDLHAEVLTSGDFGPLTKHVWSCVWPTVYREENVLSGKAEIERVRSQMAESLKLAPQQTLWMFVFAKLMFQIQAGYGLGFCADFGLD